MLLHYRPWLPLHVYVVGAHAVSHVHVTRLQSRLTQVQKVGAHAVSHVHVTRMQKQTHTRYQASTPLWAK